jgi:hypothetical protein
MMSSRVAAIAPVLIATALLVGCGEKASSGDAGKSSGGSAVPTGVTFKAGKGLLIPPESAAYLGLEMGEIAERVLVSTNRFTARFYQSGKASGVVTAEEAALLRAGQPLSVALDTGESNPGRITGLHRDALLGGMVEVLFELADDNLRVAPGSFASASVTVGKPEAVVSVPRSALLRTVEGWFVYTKSGDRLMRAAVKVGVMNDDFAEITDGLYAGDVVALKPVMKLWLAELQAIRGGADND